MPPKDGLGLEDRTPAGICCNADLDFYDMGVGKNEQRLWRRLRLVALLVAACLSGCTSLSEWTGLHLEPAPPGQAVVYPNLAKMPDRPVPLTTPEERQETVQSLTADRARTAQAGESLRHEIETGFQQPEPASGP